jgi:hypothetical protein
MAIGYVHTLGDSTLDNLFWMLDGSNVEKAKNDSVEGLLQERLKTDRLVVNSLAYDGFTTKSVLNGDKVGAVLPRSHEKKAYMRTKAPKEITVRPLEKLEQNIAARPDATHYIVLSVGGNDFRENLLTPWRLLTNLPDIQNRYLQIVEKIKSLQGRDIRPILMLQYRTDANHDPYLIYPIFQAIGIVAMTVHVACLALLTAPLWIVAGKISLLVGGAALLGGALGLYLTQKVIPLSVTKDILLGKKISHAVFGALLHAFYQPILEQAKKDRIPILDLPNTFNPHRKLYEAGIEPSKEGGALIAEGIAHIVKQHDFSKSSVLYSKSDSTATYSGVANTDPSSWQVIDV